MVADIDIELQGVDAAVASLRLTEREVRRAAGRAVQRATRRARAVVRQELRGRNVEPRLIRRRLRSKAGNVWLGANPIPADNVRGSVTVAGESPAGRQIIAIDGQIAPLAFRPGRNRRTPVFERVGPNPFPISRPMVRFPGAAEAIEAAADEAERLLPQYFDEAAEGLLRN